MLTEAQESGGSTMVGWQVRLVITSNMPGGKTLACR